MDRSHYKILADIFRYPAEGYHDRVNACYTFLEQNYPEAATKMVRFIDFINSKSLHEIEEIFSLTFHIQAVCYLDIGYVLFGEDYKRGEFLVNMKREQRDANNDCGIELPDNLPNYLVLLAISKDPELVEELAARCLKVALEKMLTEFQASRMAIRTKVMKKKQKVILLKDIEEGNIFQNAIQALLEVVKEDFKGIEYHDDKLQPSLSNVIPTCGTGCSTTDALKIETKTTEPIKTAQL